MKSLAYTLVVLFGALSFAHAAEEATAPSEVILTEATEEVVAPAQKAGELTAEDKKAD